MTKEITKAYILQELEDKLKLREFDPSPFLFSETVVPVYNIAPHLTRAEVVYEQVQVTSAPTGIPCFTVPEHEKWTIHRYDVIFLAAGAYKVTGVYVKRHLTADNIYLDMTLGQTVSYHIDLSIPLVLGPGDRLNVYIDDYTSNAYLRLYIDVMKEEVR